MVKMQEINLPPYAPILMESTRALGYSLEAAVADVIDNSISAGASKIDILFMPTPNPYFSIIDNGCGMSNETINNAMRYGSKNPSEIRSSSDLGRFGLGLKTASLSQCRKLTVISLINGSFTGRCWDLDYINKKKEWILLALSQEDISIIPNIDRLKENGQGTMVLWTELDRLIAGETSLEEAFNKKMPIVREHLSLVFHRYLSGEIGIKKIIISINNNPVVAMDPFLTNKSFQIMDNEKLFVDGKKVVIKPYILPHPSKMTMDELKMLGGNDGLRRHQGFYVYRNKRLLVWGTWFRLTKIDDLSKLARVLVDIPNTLDDHWTLDIRKSVAVPTETIKKSLRRIVEKIAGGSKRVWVTRSRKELDDSKIQLWQRFKNRDGSIHYDINRDYPLIEILKGKLENSAKQDLEQLLRLVETGLPINALRVDFGNDCSLSFDDVDKIKVIVKDTVTCLMLSSDNRELLLDTLMKTDPFSYYPDIIEEVLQEVTEIEQY